MDINYELYKVFYYVGKTLSFSEASKELFISQSAVSQSIKVLEKRLNRVLFIRSTKKVRLTPEGEILFKHVSAAINLITRGENQLCEQEDSTRGQLRIVISNSLKKEKLLSNIVDFHKHNPKIHLSIMDADSKMGAKWIEENKVDLMIGTSANNLSISNAKTVVINEFSDIFVANKEVFPLEDKVMSLEDLVKYPILMLNKENSSSEYLHNIFINNSIDFVPEMELYSNDMIMELARKGVGIAFIPEYCVGENEEELIRINIAEKIPKRKLVAIYQNEENKLDMINSFLSTIRMRQFC